MKHDKEAQMRKRCPKFQCAHCNNQHILIHRSLLIVYITTLQACAMSYQQ